MFFRCLVLFIALAGVASAETIIARNVNGYALNARGVQHFATLVIVDGKVASLLSATDKIQPLPGARIIDGKGMTLLPGLIDAHGHVLGLGQRRLQVDLRGTESLQEALDRIRQFAAERRDGWLLGRGWNQVLWPDKSFPTATQLDAVMAERPAALTRIDGHAIWINSAALRLAGIGRNTPDPSGGQIVRDGQGNPTGVLIDAAMQLIERHIPAATDADIKLALRVAMAELASLGLTGVHDAGIDMRTFRLYEELGREASLPIRIYAMLADDKADRSAIAAGPKPAQFDDRLQLRAVKAWVDGALGSRGAAMLSDYSDQPAHRGLTRYTPVELSELAKTTARHGWQLNVHAIGDAGNHIALDAFERGLSAAQRRALRPRIEHAQVIALADLPRFAKLNVIASIQPTHATSDMNMAEERIGGERIQGAYAWRKLKLAGVRLAGGSDFPVELANPFHGLYAAVTRQSRDGLPPGGWHAEEKLEREEALRLFTVDAAYAAHMEDSVGSLQPGQWADFILIDRNYLTVAQSEIDDIVVLGTYVAGNRVDAPRQ